MLREAISKVTPVTADETGDWLQPDMAKQLEAFLKKHRKPKLNEILS